MTEVIPASANIARLRESLRRNFLTAAAGSP